MHIVDWIILFSILVGIVVYGIWKTRKINSTEAFLKGNQDTPWWTIGLSVMATQASAITFLSTPGQAYEDGMGFAQFYFGLPLAMVLLCVFVLPIYYRLKVYTAYEFLENRFDLKSRTLTAGLFLLQRGMAAGLTIYAPAIILSNILHLDLTITNFIIGVLVIIYTVSGGTDAVSQTQKQQMIVILLGMFIAFVLLISKLPNGVGLGEAVDVAGNMGKMNVVDFKFDLSNRYNIWSAMFAGTFLFLSYFGTDQSQVQRYLSGKSLKEGRLGLLFNGLFKVPMQFMILFIGLMVFVFYQFNPAPIHYNEKNIATIENSNYADAFQKLQDQYTKVSTEKRAHIIGFLDASDAQRKAALKEKMNTSLAQEVSLRKEVKDLLNKYGKESNTKIVSKDGDYVFITFVMDHLPIGLIGLLLAVIFSAAMSSTASELNALATTSVMDIYKRSVAPDKEDKHYLSKSKQLTFIWGIIAIGFASIFSLFDNLIEAVNIIGSLFYGTILGIFVVALFFKKIMGNAIFYAAIIVEVIVIILYFLDYYEKIELSYLWLNPIGCILVILFSHLLTFLDSKEVA